MNRWRVLASVMALLAVPGPALALGQAARDMLEGRLAENAAGRFSSAAFTPVFGSADPVVDALVTWDRLRRPAYNGGFGEYAAFLRRYPGWPQEATLLARAERAVAATTPAAERLAHFDRFPPRTGAGAYRYAEALLAAGRGAEARRWAREAWIGADLPLALESEALARFGPTFNPDIHAARADALLWAGRTDAAARMGAWLAPDRRAWAAARIALQTKSPDAAAAVASVPPALMGDPGLLADRAKAMSEAGDFAGARRLIADTPVAPGAAFDPVKWMRLRAQYARDAERDGQYALGYRIAAGHNAFPLGRALNDRPLAERDAFTDVEWRAGWIALNGLGRPGDALRHFSRYMAGARTPTTRAKGLYWAGRAAEAAGDPARATFLEGAAAAPETFYGQLALERLGRPVRLPVAQVPSPTPADRARFEADPLAQAARALGEIGARERQTLFLKALAERADDNVERRLVADLGPRFGRPEVGVFVGKAARQDGEALKPYAYPTLSAGGLYGGLWTMAHAITRQESQFDREALSSAGARGLMQLMPGTAREQAGKVGLPYEQRRLFTDENYNVTLGSTYYQRLLDRWGGNHVLAVASYNAGAGNVNKWVTANGDPRLPGVDPVAWIEQIPFTETRNYVQRVLENAVVYDLLRPQMARTPETNRLSLYLGKGRPG